MKNPSVKTQLLGMLAGLVMVLVVFALAVWMALGAITGAADDMAQGKDLVADILPPPLYVLEAELTVMQLLDAQAAQLPPMLARLAALKQDYDQRNAFWERATLNQEVRNALLGEQKRSADAFWQLVLGDYVAAIKQENAAQARQLAAQAQQLYAAHRDSVDATVKLATAYADDTLKSLQQRSRQLLWLVIGLAGAGLLAAIAMAMVIRDILRRLGGEPAEAAAAAGRIAGGDLAQAIALAPADHGSLLAALKTMQSRLGDTLREVEDCGRHMGQSAYRITTISHEIASVSQEQQGRASEVSGAMQQLHQISSDVQTQTIAAADRSHQADAMASEALEKMRQNIDSMAATTQEVGRASLEIQQLDESARQIHDIVNAIKEIAGQTNLLALNAAIEAARAGEQGRGFAVVADEVRKLADRTSLSAVEVGEIIRRLSEMVHTVVATMDVVVQQVGVTQDEARKAAQIIEGMASNATATARANQGISSASRQQLDHLARVQATLDTLFSILQDSTTKVGNTAAIGDELRIVAERLNHIMSGFTFASSRPLAAVHDENAPWASLAGQDANLQ